MPPVITVTLLTRASYHSDTVTYGLADLCCFLDQEHPPIAQCKVPLGTLLLRWLARLDRVQRNKLLPIMSILGE